MSILSSFIISSAFAQDAAATPVTSNTALMNYLPFILIFGVFYLLVIRPQQKKLEEQTRMIKALQRGDRVILGGGIHGKIARLEGDDLLIVEIADNVQIKVDRVQVQALEAKTQPAISETEKK